MDAMSILSSQSHRRWRMCIPISSKLAVMLSRQILLAARVLFLQNMACRIVHTNLNFKAAQIAKRIAQDYSGNGHQRFVAGSMGPTTKLPSLGHISFKEMAAAYHEQAKGLVEGGVDLLCVETCQDILQTKSALYGIFEYLEQSRHRVPIIVSMTIESMGTMLLAQKSLQR